MRKIIKEIYQYVLIIVIVLVIKKFIISPIRVIGPSMKDTLLNGDIMLLDKLHYRFHDIERFDIVVVNYEKDLIIKRVIGLPGDKVEYINNKLYINDELYEEPYLATGTVTEDFSISTITGNSIIPSDFYLVLGDNREESSDSRNIGLINKDDIEGLAKYTLYPFNRFGPKV